MIEVIIFSRKDCHLCDQAKQHLDELRNEVAHKVTVVDVDSDSDLRKEYGSNVPVVKVGPYTLKAPIERSDLLITLKAAQFREQQIKDVDASIASTSVIGAVRWTRSDSFTLWLSKHYLSLFNIFIFLYVALPFMAPVLMKVGAAKPAGWIYRAYGVVCHELAFRSWFLFGEQAVYPRASAEVDGLIPYQDATGQDESDLWAARDYIGNEFVGYKVALCERDVAIYGGILLFGILFAFTGRRMRPIHWLIWILIGIIPIGIDGLSQLASQPPMNFFVFRESTPFLRTLTGFLFGFMTAWFGYPYVEDTMSQNRRYLAVKFQRAHDSEMDAVSASSTKSTNSFGN